VAGAARRAGGRGASGRPVAIATAPKLPCAGGAFAAYRRFSSGRGYARTRAGAPRRPPRHFESGRTQSIAARSRLRAARVTPASDATAARPGDRRGPEDGRFRRAFLGRASRGCATSPSPPPVLSRSLPFSPVPLHFVQRGTRKRKRLHALTSFTYVFYGDLRLPDAAMLSLPSIENNAKILLYSTFPIDSRLFQPPRSLLIIIKPRICMYPSNLWP
jgi:hypothetical protein